MHELAVTQNILDTSLKHACAANASKILRIKIVVGQFTSIIDDSVEFYWRMIAQDTIAQESILDFERIPASFVCQDCQTSFNWDDNMYACPSCDSVNIKITSGTELFIESIDIE